MNHSRPLEIHYDFLPEFVRKDPDFGKKMQFMRSVGITNVWLACFFYGTWTSSPEEIADAKAFLEGEGFEVQALNVPFGHGGQALDPSQPVDTATGDGWQSRVDADGNPWPNTTCVDDTVIRDSRRVNETLRDIGFTKVFYDDDLRLATWGPHMQGCFCDRCMKRFYGRYPQYDGISRREIVNLSATDPALRDAWETVQCDSVLRFLDETTPAGMEPGMMIMHNGDRRHGLDVRRMKEHFPHGLFRVGEGHFGDGSFLHPDARAAIANSIKNHLHLLGTNENVFSESTTYPVGDLSPENWIEKMRIEIDCGLRNLFLMSGTVFLTEPYWHALEKALPELEERAERTPIPDLGAEPEPFVWHL